MSNAAAMTACKTRTPMVCCNRHACVLRLWRGQDHRPAVRLHRPRIGAKRLADVSHPPRAGALKPKPSRSPAPRSQPIDPSTPGFFHWVSRCVRRAFLCGADGYTGRSFEQRRQWVEDRLLQLADRVAVGPHAYAGMAALRMSSITCRIATGAQAGRKIVTLQILPRNDGPLGSDAGKGSHAAAAPPRAETRGARPGASARALA
jgi:hypothetical protein